ncbi:MAG: hypothetical protein NC390_02325 [Fusobacterium sp.]|nr:hypothetical protein [Fusobacterium sp.]
MPKPIINNKSHTSFEKLSFIEMDTFKNPELAFRQKRPQSYLILMKNLDVDGAQISEDKLNEIINELHNTVPQISLDETFLGVLGKCYLGTGYDVHTLSKSIIFGLDESTHLLGYGRMILKHFKIGESLPVELERARNLASNPNYQFIEVYSNKIIAVLADGNVAIIKK